MTVYPITYNDDIIKSVLSQKVITPADLDYERAQTLDDFTGYKNLHIKYLPEDFLVLLSEETESMLVLGSSIGLEEAEMFGWYGTRAHEANISILTESGGVKIKNIKMLNPALRIEPFETMRRGYHLRRRNNVLAGGFGLCYHCFREEYDNFFAKLKLSKDLWILKLSDYDQKTDGFILFQLLVFSGQRMESYINEIYGGNPLFSLLAPVCSNSAGYFFEKSYDVRGYLEFTARALRAMPETAGTSTAVEELLLNYIDKGIPYEPSDAFAKIIKEFIDLAATETENLRKFLESNPTNRKAAIFLLGMLHTASRLEDQFNFDNFTLLLPAAIAERFDCVQKNENELRFIFNSAGAFSAANSGIDRLELVNDYISGLRTVKKILPEINQIKNSAHTLEAVLQNETIISVFKKELPALKETGKNLEQENLRLQGDIEKMKARNREMAKQKQELEQNYKSLIRDLESLHTKLETFKRENAMLKIPDFSLRDDESAGAAIAEQPALNGEKFSVLKNYEKLVEEQEKEKLEDESKVTEEKTESKKEKQGTNRSNRKVKATHTKSGSRGAGEFDFKNDLIKTPGGAAGGIEVRNEIKDNNSSEALN